MNQLKTILTRNAPNWHENEWKKILSSTVSSPEALLAQLEIPQESLPFPLLKQHPFGQKAPQPYINRIKKGDANDPLLLQILPFQEELNQANGFVSDPLSEHKSQLPGMLHKYKSRVLFMLATTCAINCRYCFRREFPYDENTAGKSGWQELFSYLREHPEIDEVILSGGDPLAVNDAYLHRFIEQVSQIPSLKRIRIHTRLPVVIPQRVTQGLLNALTSTHLQTVMVIHANHANEIDDEVEHALKLLHRAGVTLLNQSVLLKNINDHADTLAQLSNRLFECQVLPYYLHQLDKVSGIHHFNVPLTTARAIMLELQSQVAGFLVPRFVAEIAGESSKTLVDLLHKNQ